MTQGIFIEDVLFDAYNPKTKIPLKILVNKFMTSAYSFKRVTIVIIKITSRRMQIMEKHSRFTPFFVFALPSKVSCFIYIPPSYLLSFLPKFHETYQFCAFIDDIYMISDLITQQDDIKVIEIKDYIKNPKPNGYRSYHMIVEIPVFFAKGKTPMRVELQIRTNGMDFWATLEHQLRYKKGIEEMPGYDEISEELLHSARAIIEADNEMQRIKDKIGMFHEI